MLDDIPLHDKRSERDQDDGNFDKNLFQFADIGAIDLKAELAEQYAKAKTLYANVETSSCFTPNQKASVLNAVTAILAAITKEQAKVHNMERLKAMEAALIEALKTLPEEAQQVFYNQYEANLASIPA